MSTFSSFNEIKPNKKIDTKIKIKNNYISLFKITKIKNLVK